MTWDIIADKSCHLPDRKSICIGNWCVHYVHTQNIGLKNISQKHYSSLRKIEPLFFLDYSANMYSRKTMLHTIVGGFSDLCWIFSELFKKNRGSNFSQPTVKCCRTSHVLNPLNFVLTCILCDFAYVHLHAWTLPAHEQTWNTITIWAFLTFRGNALL